MKTTGFFLIGICMLGPAGFGSESNFDALPLGPSEFRYALGKLEKGQLMETRSGRIVNISDLIASAGNIDVFVIGESHDSYDCHALQRDFIEALFKQYPRLVVGLEFFTREDDAVLEKWRNGSISETEFIEKTGWYQKTALNYAYTRMVMDVIQKHRIKAIGLNISREIMHRISRSGFETLSPEEKNLFPKMGKLHPEHRYFIKIVFGVFALQVPAWFEKVYQAQVCWDAVMAESMGRVLRQKEFREYKGVMIAGSYHVAYKLGIPFRFQESDQKARLATIVPVAVSQDGGETEEEPNPMKKMLAKNLPAVTVFSRGIGDYVFAFESPGEADSPVLGITARSAENGIEIASIQKKSIARESGLRTGDKIVGLGGIKIESLEHFRLLISKKTWGDSFWLGVEKKIDFFQKNPEPPGKK